MTYHRSENQVSKPKATQSYVDPNAGPLFSVRFAVSLLLIALGIAWIVFYYLQVRVDPTVVPAPKAGSPKFMADLKDWNYAIGFGLAFFGLAFAAHPSTPLGRGRGVVTAMLGCFILGLIWICTFYVLGDNLDKAPIMNDLGQFNLMVGIAFMGVGFSFATRWE